MEIVNFMQECGMLAYFETTPSSYVKRSGSGEMFEKTSQE